MGKNDFINIRVSKDFAIELDNLHGNYKESEMVSISFSSFLEMLLKHGVKAIRNRVDSTAYATTDTN